MKKLNKLKVCCLITSILAIITIALNKTDIRINIACLVLIIINYLYIMTPIKRKRKK